MQILIAEDDATNRLVLESTLKRWEYEVVTTVDGAEAWEVLQQDNPPQLAILDWMMPNMDGVEVCRRVRAQENLQHLYIIILTARDTTDDIAEALNSGADDYVAKPFNRKELQARIQVGRRVLDLQIALAQRVRQLEESSEREKHLQGLLPICSYCKKIRDDQNYWQQVESYIGARSEAAFSHSICPDCYQKIVQPQLDDLNSRSNATEEDQAS